VSYEHSQQGRWIQALLGGAIIVVVGAAALLDGPAWVRGVLILAAAIYYWLLITFGRLEVRIEAQVIAVSFGRGWPHRVIPLATVTAVAARRGRWWYGWGIRRIPSGWLWNVWGLDFVEIRHAGDKIFNVGTDEPLALVAAINQGIDPSVP
jgi:hypothetical protein